MKKKGKRKEAGKRSLAALVFALDNEMQGVDLYMELGRKTDNMLAKKLFYTLAKQEIDHVQRFSEIHASVTVGKEWGSLSVVKLPSVEKEMKAYFRKARARDMKMTGMPLPGYQLAMEMEKTSYTTYETLLNEATTAEEKSFYRQLMLEENGHLEALQNVYQYLTAPEDWLQEDESRVWNWMNM